MRTYVNLHSFSKRALKVPRGRDSQRGARLRALGEGLRALAGAQGGEHADERGGKFVRTSAGPVSAPSRCPADAGEVVGDR